ncbi:unnamed protein product [Lactuca saligna]|uniref:Uncharacterized protein n=1 Tax=Lactuca saligna TaxID=75948 RepID=A0AA35ZLE9_LACSI|nr:unnamed protein product [Lactuca saligna]
MFFQSSTLAHINWPCTSSTSAYRSPNQSSPSSHHRCCLITF